MPRPTETPVGLALSRAARAVERAFDEALVRAGSSRPVWLILMTLKTSPPSTQSELAAAVGIRGATLSHHLTAMEERGLVTRTRATGNRRVQVVEMTGAGRAMFETLVSVARAHDQRLRSGLDEPTLRAFRDVLDKLRANVG